MALVIKEKSDNVFQILKEETKYDINGNAVTMGNLVKDDVTLQELNIEKGKLQDSIATIDEYISLINNFGG